MPRLGWLLHIWRAGELDSKMCDCSVLCPLAAVNPEHMPDAAIKLGSSLQLRKLCCGFVCCARNGDWKAKNRFSLSSHRCVHDTRQFENCFRKIENSRIRIFACFGLHQTFLNFRLFGFFALQRSLRARHAKIRKSENSNFRRKVENSEKTDVNRKTRKFEFRVFEFSICCVSCTQRWLENEKPEKSKIRKKMM